MRPVDIFISAGTFDQEAYQFAVDARTALAREGVDVAVIFQDRESPLRELTLRKNLAFDLSEIDSPREDAVTLIVSVPEAIGEESNKIMSYDFSNVIFALNSEQTENACYSMRSFDHHRTIAAINAWDSVFSTDASEHGGKTFFNDCALIDINSVAYNSSDIASRKDKFFSYRNGKNRINGALRAYNKMGANNDFSTFACFADAYADDISKFLTTSRFGYYYSSRNSIDKILLEMIACHMIVFVDSKWVASDICKKLPSSLRANVKAVGDWYDVLEHAEIISRGSFDKYSFKTFANLVTPFL